jgi:succinyl-CoA synthetase beta subunit
MRIHEYQAKKVLRKFGVPVPLGEVVFSAQEAMEMAAKFGNDCVLKAQIHAGGRGAGGGVKRAQNREEVEAKAKEIIGMTLVTRQTGPKGRKVRRMLVEEAVEIDREIYMSILLDRATASPLILASAEGGMDIEELAAKSPEKILRERIDPGTGLMPFQGRKIAFRMGLKGDLVKQMVNLVAGLYQAFRDTDASLVEINPLVVTREGMLLALDAKMSFDDNGLFRHPDLKDLRDLDEEDPLEVEASQHGLNYIRLDGNVGCMVNGAGLAMATMDIIKAEGGEPANFLDVGGGASADQVAQGFKILLSDDNVRAILINIFGGIVRCDRVASGVVEAVSKVGVNCPIVVRLQGTNADEGRQILEKSGLNFAVARELKDAARQAVQRVEAGDAGAKEEVTS